jgi:hypothetical protein
MALGNRYIKVEVVRNVGFKLYFEESQGELLCTLLDDKKDKVYLKFWF